MKSPVSGVEFVRKVGDVKEFTLSKNGLRILLALDSSSPVAGVMVTYHVGSRNEAVGYTGATHLLEHLMFKGTKKFPHTRGGTDELEAKGALLNATTWMDRTNYYEIVPIDTLPFAVEFEASRMRDAFITDKDRISEMPVVWNEFERGENNSEEALDKLIWSTAYQAHPYHHSTIGWRSDIENISIERLKQFYDDFYWPNNATVSIVGGIGEKEALNLVKKNFGPIPRSPKPIPPMYTTEPTQEGERRVVIERTGPNIFGIAYKTPNAHHKDFPAITMLGAVLAGHKFSRLERLLVDTAQATSVSCHSIPTHDPGLMNIYCTLAEQVTHQEVEEKLSAELMRIAKEGVTESELHQARTFVRTDTAAKRDGAYAFLSALNEDIATGDWTRFVTFPKALLRVTPSDIQRVAKTYLQTSQSTVGWCIGKRV